MFIKIWTTHKKYGQILIVHVDSLIIRSAKPYLATPGATVLGIRSFQPSTLLSRFIDIEPIERTSKICSTFRRPCVMSPDRDFSYINVTNVSPSERVSP